MKTPVRTRLLSALLSLVMLVSLLPVSVFAAEPEAGTWTKVELADITADDTVAITMTKGDSTWVLPNNGDAKAAANAAPPLFMNSRRVIVFLLCSDLKRVYTLSGTSKPFRYSRAR